MLFKPNETGKVTGEPRRAQGPRARPQVRLDRHHAPDPRRPRLCRLDRACSRSRPPRAATGVRICRCRCWRRRRAVQDVPVYLDGVGTVRALNTVTVRSQVDGKLIAVNFTEGQDVKKGDVLGEIDPAIYQAQYDQAVAKKAQDEALLANQRLDLIRYQQLAASNAGSKQQADTQRATGRPAGGADQGRSGRDRQRAGDAWLHQDHCAALGPRRPAPGRPGQHHPRRRRHRPRHHHPVAADRGAVQPAAAADHARQRGRRQGRARGRCVRQ